MTVHKCGRRITQYNIEQFYNLPSYLQIITQMLAIQEASQWQGRC